MTELILAFDHHPDLNYLPENHTISLVEEFGGLVDGVKLGHKALVESQKLVEFCKHSNLTVFIDLKIHDIPSVASDCVRYCDDQGADYLTVSALAGTETLSAAEKAAEDIEIIGVNVLSSLKPPTIFYREVESVGREVFKILRRSGVDITTGHASIADILESWEGRTVLTGIRLDKDEDQDHSSTLTPEEASSLNPELIIVGRPILQSDQPEQVIKEYREEIERGKT